MKQKGLKQQMQEVVDKEEAWKLLAITFYNDYPPKYIRRLFRIYDVRFPKG